jgi:DnaJ-domain-containing protein 1
MRARSRARARSEVACPHVRAPHAHPVPAPRRFPPARSHRSDRPRDALSAAASGAGHIAKGVAAGALALATAPVRGARAGGFAGFAEGLGRGLVGAVALPAAGVAAAGWQLGWGVLGTPEAVVRACCGHTWDEARAAWAPYSLPQELADVRAHGDRRAVLARLAERLSAADAAGSVAAADAARRAAAAEAAGGAPGGGDGAGAPARGRTRTVASLGHYETLGVDPAASAAQIRRAYYAKAREAHPDKRPGDPVAAAEFQKLSAAYQTLASPQARALYDEIGEAAAEAAGRDGFGGDGGPAVDASVFFGVLFGHEQFLYLTGELALGAAAQLGIDAAMLPAALAARHVGADAADPAELARRGGAHFGAHAYLRSGRVTAALRAVQRCREAEVAATLAALLQPYAEAAGAADPAAAEAAAGFAPFWAREAARLGACAFGRPLLATLAEAYRTAARAWQGTRANAGPAALADALSASFDGARLALAHRADVASAALGASTAAARVAVSAAAAESDDGPGAGLAAAWAEAFAPGAAADPSAGSAGALAIRTALPALLRAGWAMTALDVRATAVAACEKLLNDTSVPQAARAARADGLVLLAAAFAAEAARAAPGDAPPPPPPVATSTALAKPAASADAGERARALALVEAECARAKEQIELALARTVASGAERARERRDATEEAEAAGREARSTHFGPGARDDDDDDGGAQ